MVQLSLKKVWQDPIYFLAFGFGSGLAPFAPGTFGTVAALPLYFLLALLPPQIYLVMTLLAFALGNTPFTKKRPDLSSASLSMVGVTSNTITSMSNCFIISPKLVFYGINQKKFVLFLYESLI